MTDDTLVAELRKAQKAATHDCKMCEAINGTPAGERRDALVAAAAGTIGIRKLVGILRAHDIQVGRIVLERHRTEGHAL